MSPRRKRSFPVLAEGRQHAVEEVDRVLLVRVGVLLADDEVAHLALRLRLLRRNVLEEGVLEDGLGLLLLLLELEVPVQHDLYARRLLLLLGVLGLLGLVGQ